MTTSTRDSASKKAADMMFPLTRGRKRGYDREAVDAFLLRARKSFEASPEEPMRSSDVRLAAFRLVRKGYEVAAVDQALARIEDAFAARERETAIAKHGSAAWVQQHRALAQETLDRFSRPAKRRFDRVNPFRFGYRVDEVDHVSEKLAAHLRSGEPLTVEQVRQVAFRMKRRGYREEQVDAALDAVIEVLLGVG